jgi:hypothetical protein
MAELQNISIVTVAWKFISGVNWQLMAPFVFPLDDLL